MTGAGEGPCWRCDPGAHFDAPETCRWCDEDRSGDPGGDPGSPPAPAPAPAPATQSRLTEYGLTESVLRGGGD